MPANFTEEQRATIRERLLVIGYEMVQEMGLRQMKVSLIAKRADIATGTFYHFFASKEAYVMALIEEKGKSWQEKFLQDVRDNGKLTLKQAVKYLRESFRTENNLLMGLTLDDWVWLKSHRTKEGMFDAVHDYKEAERYLACIVDIRPDLEVRVIINFFKTIYSMAQNRDTFIAEVFETNVDMIFECMYAYARISDKK